MFDLKGRTVVITGASSGLGKAAVYAYAKAGAAVLITARRFERLEAIREELAAQEKPKVEAYCKSIVDARMYLVFRLRFIRCYSWAEVAGVLGKGYTEDGVSRMAYNYLNKN